MWSGQDKIWSYAKSWFTHLFTHLLQCWPSFAGEILDHFKPMDTTHTQKCVGLLCIRSEISETPLEPLKNVRSLRDGNTTMQLINRFKHQQWCMSHTHKYRYQSCWSLSAHTHMCVRLSSSGTVRLLFPLCAFLHTYWSCLFACRILPFVRFPCRFCLPGDRQGSAGSVEVLLPNFHQECSPSSPTPHPGCPLQRHTQRPEVSRVQMFIHTVCISNFSPDNLL